MPARKKSTTNVPMRTLRTTMNALIGARIDFKVHYPTKNSMVITVDNDMNHAQLKTFVDNGGSFGPGKNLMILVPDLGANDAK